ncbi:MAG: hypothetical protein Q7J67_02355 [bacterium]|nr:hypothetical protein [bacterium]
MNPYIPITLLFVLGPVFLLMSLNMRKISHLEKQLRNINHNLKALCNKFEIKFADDNEVIANTKDEISNLIKAGKVNEAKRLAKDNLVDSSEIMGFIKDLKNKRLISNKK